jgi:hypothetical protein
MQKECPLCGDVMTLHIRETIERVPGTPQEVRRENREWLCRDCDYFEDVEEGDLDEKPAPEAPGS